MKNQTQLITYVDRISGGGLDDLRALLRGPLAGCFGAVHLLPFFHPIDGADAGFDPIDHLQVDPRLGHWHDVQTLAQTVDVMADVIVNHISSASPQFLAYSRDGAASPYDGMFLTFDAVFPNGATEHDLLAIFRPRPQLPFTSTTLQSGQRRILWTTFTPRQIDIDVHDPEGRRYLESILRTLAQYGVKMVRLDAVGYAIKKAGSSCFMMPETFDFITDFAASARALGVEVLVEVHSHYERQIEIAARVDWVYDFALPPLVLHALFFGTARYLKRWVQIRPRNALTVLDTHDGIGIIDIGADGAGRPGLVPPAELDQLVERIHENSGGVSRNATGAAASNLDLYQVNCTFFDALGRDARAYLLARAIQFFLPGVPQVYYVGLVAGTNDAELLARTSIGRDINRHYFQRDEFAQAIQTPVAQDLLALIRLRNAHPAFGGVFQVLHGGDTELGFEWRAGVTYARLQLELSNLEYTLSYSDLGGEQRMVFASAERGVS